MAPKKVRNRFEVWIPLPVTVTTHWQNPYVFSVLTVIFSIWNWNKVRFLSQRSSKGLVPLREQGQRVESQRYEER